MINPTMRDLEPKSSQALWLGSLLTLLLLTPSLLAQADGQDGPICRHTLEVVVHGDVPSRAQPFELSEARGEAVLHHAPPLPALGAEAGRRIRVVYGLPGFRQSMVERNRSFPQGLDCSTILLWVVAIHL